MSAERCSERSFTQTILVYAFDHHTVDRWSVLVGALSEQSVEIRRHFTSRKRMVAWSELYITRSVQDVKYMIYILLEIMYTLTCDVKRE